METCRYYYSYKNIPTKDWGSVVASTNLYLSHSYLSALEDGLKSNFQSIYVLIYDENNNPLIAAIFQIIRFTSKTIIEKNLFLKLFQDCRNTDNSFSLNCLVCGNMFATGENGFAFTDSITKEKAINLLGDVTKNLPNNSVFKDNFDVILFKEFWKDTIQVGLEFDHFKFRKFQIDVNMVLEIQPEWNTFEDYLQSMKAKYRTKANSAFKKSDVLHVKSLSAIEIQANALKIEALFLNVLEKSDYSYVENYTDCFYYFKMTLGENFICKGVFLEDAMIGFSAAFLNNDCIEANYVGVDYTYNTKYAVYERLLYEYVEVAISLKKGVLHLGRTSELIKSALGAKPVNMWLYGKHKSKVKNILLKPFLNNLKPAAYTLRSPFKN